MTRESDEELLKKADKYGFRLASPLSSKPDPIGSCLQCGKELFSGSRRHTKLYCSRSCAQKVFYKRRRDRTSLDPQDSG
jgi:hypothetical protein